MRRIMQKMKNAGKQMFGKRRPFLKVRSHSVEIQAYRHQCVATLDRFVVLYVARVSKDAAGQEKRRNGFYPKDLRAMYVAIQQCAAKLARETSLDASTRKQMVAVARLIKALPKLNEAFPNTARLVEMLDAYQHLETLFGSDDESLAALLRAAQPMQHYIVAPR